VGRAGTDRENVKLLDLRRIEAPTNKGMERRKGGGSDGKGRGEQAAKWSFLHRFLLLLKDPRTQISKRIVKMPCLLSDKSRWESSARLGKRFGAW